MNSGEGPEGGTHCASPAFILSFANRDDLAAAVMASGWRPIAARRADAVSARFLASGACIAIVDGRKDYADAIAAARALYAPVQAHHAALLILTPDARTETLEAAYQAGATHILSAPFDEAVLGVHLRLAVRHANRMGAPRGAGASPAGRVDNWRWHPGPGTVVVSAGLGVLQLVIFTPLSITLKDHL